MEYNSNCYLHAMVVTTKLQYEFYQVALYVLAISYVDGTLLRLVFGVSSANMLHHNFSFHFQHILNNT
ncbi:hypothetical protein BI323_06395 [Yersinia ruckeri]|nr:hypothetical protein BI323_06395 [Yersinia ruckeri]